MTMNDALLDPMATPGTSHANPAFDYLTGFVPRKLKDLFKWAEYLAYNSAHIYAVVKKFGEYPITRFVYETTEPKSKAQHQYLFEKILRMKGFLTEVSFDKFIYGNVFVSRYAPVMRFLACRSCKVKEAITAADYEYSDTRVEFKLKCRKCQHKGVAEVEDVRLNDPEKMALIRWDPKLIDIDHNPITGKSVYFYQIPRDLIQKVRAGNKNVIDHMPMEMLKAMKNGKTFKFAEGEIYHLKVPGPAGVESQWGFPPLTSAIKLFLFAATLRKANEAIALEHITPFRVFHPTQAASNGDPFASVNLKEWRTETERNYKLFRRDPLRIQFSPIPLGVQNIGGDGKALLTLGELQEAEKNIVLSMGVPLEFLSGGLGQTRGEITLRMIENQLQTHIEDLNALIQWVERQCTKSLNWSSIPMRLADFKMIDDSDQKNMLFQLWQQGKVSDTTLAEALDLDLERERKQRMEDTLADAKMQQRTQAAMNRLQSSLAHRAQSQAAASQGGGLTYDTQAIIAQADMIVQELSSLDPGSRRSRMDALKSEDLVMAAMVRERLEQSQQDAEAAQKAQQ